MTKQQLINEVDKKVIHRWDFDYSEFVNYCKEKKGVSVVGNKDSEEKDEEFCGTKSFSDALDFAENGFDDGIQKMQDIFDKIDVIGKQYTFHPKFETSGESVDVGRFLSGEPENMLEWELVETQGRKVVDLYWNMSTQANTEAIEMIGFGACGLSIVDYLESIGIRVNLFVFDYCASMNSNHYFLICVNIKKANEHLNLPVVSFAMANPSMLRRLVFKVQEQDKNYHDYGYGRPRSLTKKELNMGDDVVVFGSINGAYAGYNFKNENDMKRWISNNTETCLNELKIDNK